MLKTLCTSNQNCLHHHYYHKSSVPTHTVFPLIRLNKIEYSWPWRKKRCSSNGSHISLNLICSFSRTHETARLITASPYKWTSFTNVGRRNSLYQVKWPEYIDRGSKYIYNSSNKFKRRWQSCAFSFKIVNMILI